MPCGAHHDRLSEPVPLFFHAGGDYVREGTLNYQDLQSDIGCDEADAQDGKRAAWLCPSEPASEGGAERLVFSVAFVTVLLVVVVSFCHLV